MPKGKPISVVIGNRIVRLPPAIDAESDFSAIIAEEINEIWATNVLSALRTWRRANTHATRAQFFAEAKRLEAMHPLGAPRRNSDDDPIEAEALEIAREMLRKRLAAEGLPEPKNIDEHARQVLEFRPQIREEAERRVEAKLIEQTRTLKLLGI